MTLSPRMATLQWVGNFDLTFRRVGRSYFPAAIVEKRKPRREASLGAVSHLLRLYRTGKVGECEHRNELSACSATLEPRNHLVAEVRAELVWGRQAGSSLAG
jgi:hypothetical protein